MNTYYLFRNQSTLAYRYYLRENIEDLDNAETIILNEEDMNYIKDCFNTIKPLKLTSYTEFSNEELKEAIDNLKVFETKENCPVSTVFLNRLIKDLKEAYHKESGLIIDSNI